MYILKLLAEISFTILIFKTLKYIAQYRALPFYVQFTAFKYNTRHVIFFANLGKSMNCQKQFVKYNEFFFPYKLIRLMLATCHQNPAIKGEIWKNLLNLELKEIFFYLENTDFQLIVLLNQSHV